MNYSQSNDILELIKRTNKILIGCHSRPDPDSIGCALALKLVLGDMGKSVLIESPTDIERNVDYLPCYSDINIIDFNNFNFGNYDLFICLDSSNMEMVSDDKGNKSVNIPIVNIDHHKTNERFGMINLVESESASCGEIVFNLFKDWGVKISKDIADCLMAAIVADTGGFRFLATTGKTFMIASELMEKGADKNRAILNVLSSFDIKTVKFWGMILESMQVDDSNMFVWSAINYEDYCRAGSPENGKETAATNFGQIVKDTDFSMIMVERKKNVLAISLRSRTGFDTSKIALELGGGGHIYASGARIKDMSFDNAVERVLQVARKYAKK